MDHPSKLSTPARFDAGPMQRRAIYGPFAVSTHNGPGAFSIPGRLGSLIARTVKLRVGGRT